MTVSPPPTDTDRAAGACRVTAPDLSAAEQAFLARPAVDAAEDARIEVVARALAEAEDYSWRSVFEATREHYHRLATAALAALGGAAGETETARGTATDVEDATRAHFGRAYAPPGGPIDGVTKLAQASFRAGYVIAPRRAGRAAVSGDCGHPTNWPHSAEGVGCLHDHPAVPAPVQGSDGLREEIAAEFGRHQGLRGPMDDERPDVWQNRCACGWDDGDETPGWRERYRLHIADAVLVLPSVRRLLEAEAAVQRVREVLDRAAEEADANIESDHAIGMDEVVHRARRALGSQPTGGES